MPERSLDLPTDAWTRLDNLARRLGLPLAQTLAQLAERIELLNHAAEVLAAPIPAGQMPLRCTAGAQDGEIALLLVRDRRIRTRLNHRNEDFVDVMRRLHFKWDGEYWVLDVNKFSEPVADRIVELGVHLLAAGFIVEVTSEELRRRILASEYTPAIVNWVTARTKGKFAGWFCVQWNREAAGANDYYGRLSLIRGTRCYPGAALVRSDRYEEVLDFAGLHNFAVSDGALDLAAQARREHDAMLLVTPHIQRPAPPPEPEPEPAIPEGILDELADEPV